MWPPPGECVQLLHTTAGLVTWHLACALQPPSLKPQKTYLKRKGMSSALLTPLSASEEPSILSGLRVPQSGSALMNETPGNIQHSVAQGDSVTPAAEKGFMSGLTGCSTWVFPSGTSSEDCQMRKTGTVVFPSASKGVTLWLTDQVFDCQDKWIQMNLGTRRRDCRTSRLGTK